MDWTKARPLDAIATIPKPSGDITDISNDISALITLAQGAGSPSHIRCYCQGMYYDFDFFEVTFPRARFGFVSEIDESQYIVKILRNKNLPFPLPQPVHDYALMNMFKIRGSTYNVAELTITELLHVLGLDDTVDLTPFLQDEWVCSSGYEHIMTRVGYPFRPDLNDKCVAPIDIVKSPVAEEVI